jgi:hypothetical protein
MYFLPFLLPVSQVAAALQAQAQEAATVLEAARERAAALAARAADTESLTSPTLEVGVGK